MIYSEPKLDESSGKWVVNIYYDDGENLKDSKEYDSEKIALEERLSMIKSSGKELVKSDKKNLEKDSNVLEQMIDIDENEKMVGDIFGGETAEDLQKKLDDHKSEFEIEEDNCKTEAKGLLLQVAKIYLDAKFVEENKYLQFKLGLEEKGLATLVFQLNVTRKAVFKLSEKIYCDEATPRHFEVLTQLNRVILDITKYQHEHLQKLEDSMKKFQLDAEEAGISKKEDNTVIDTEGVVIDTRSRKDLLKSINTLIKDSKDIKTPKSRNTRLHDNDPDVEEHEEIKHEGEREEDLTQEGTGLDTWEDENIE